MNHWDDLRFVLALARNGTVTAAAQSLGVTHTTVSRRVRAFEKRRGVRLFDRLPEGWVVTPAGEVVTGIAEEMEERVLVLDRDLTGRDVRLQGPLRFTTVDSFLWWLAPDLDAFVQAYPDVWVEVFATTTAVSLARREADVALRMTNDPPEHLVGRRVGHLAYAVYGARRLVERIGPDTPLGEYPWVAWDARLGARLTERWMAQNVPNARIVLRLDATSAMMASVVGGVGLAHLTCIDADANPDLVRLTGPIPGFGLDLWMLLHPDLRRTARVRVFMQEVGDRIIRRRKALHGGLDAPP